MCTTGKPSVSSKETKATALVLDICRDSRGCGDHESISRGRCVKHHLEPHRVSAVSTVSTVDGMKRSSRLQAGPDRPVPPGFRLGAYTFRPGRRPAWRRAEAGGHCTHLTPSGRARYNHGDDLDHDQSRNRPVRPRLDLGAILGSSQWALLCEMPADRPRAISARVNGGNVTAPGRRGRAGCCIFQLYMGIDGVRGDGGPDG
jgi:hypothetical protein